MPARRTCQPGRPGGSGTPSKQPGDARYSATRLRACAKPYRACRHTHPSALPQPADSSRKASAGLMPQWPWTTLDSVLRSTPSRLAAALTLGSAPRSAASGPYAATRYRSARMRRVAPQRSILGRCDLALTLVLAEYPGERIECGGTPMSARASATRRCCGRRSARGRPRSDPVSTGWTCG